MHFTEFPPGETHRIHVNSASFLFKTRGDLPEFTWFVRWVVVNRYIPDGGVRWHNPAKHIRPCRMSAPWQFHFDKVCHTPLDTKPPSELNMIHLLLHSNQTTELEYSNLWQYLLCMSQRRTVNYLLWQGEYCESGAENNAIYFPLTMQCYKLLTN